MNEAVQSMLDTYRCRSSKDYENALKEIIQEISLLGLWRAKFFEYAAFYGGSALRIVYDLDRFSEDLDFSLLRPNPSFKINRFLSAIAAELGGFGFDMTVQPVMKHVPSPIQSAFIKANTRKNLLVIQTPPEITGRMHREAALKIKLEVDIDPPGGFATEAKTRLLPVPFTILTYQLPDLFAGKIHALLFRQRRFNTKGRDWYDFVWYLARSVPLRLSHLKARMIQSGDWQNKNKLTRETVLELMGRRIENTDFETAKADVARFIRDPASLTLWSKPFFHEATARLNTI